jgi:hypothetical protein
VNSAPIAITSGTDANSDKSKSNTELSTAATAETTQPPTTSNTNPTTPAQDEENLFVNTGETINDIDEPTVGFNPFASRAKTSFAPALKPQGSVPHQNDPKSTPTQDNAAKNPKQDQPKPKLINLRVSDRMGTTLKVAVLQSDTIFKVKQQIGMKIGRRPERMTLSRAKINLKDNVTVSDYELADGVNLELM